jgi:hypothetical protein
MRLLAELKDKQTKKYVFSNWIWRLSITGETVMSITGGTTLQPPPKVVIQEASMPSSDDDCFTEAINTRSYTAIYVLTWGAGDGASTSAR